MLTIPPLVARPNWHGEQKASGGGDGTTVGNCGGSAGDGGSDENGDKRSKSGKGGAVES